MDAPAAWPPLPYGDWRATKQTLHRYAQIAGKVRMALVPRLNHWWHVTLLLSARGLTTGPMPAGDRYAEIAFDFVAHRVDVTTSDGGQRRIVLEDGLSCASFHDELFAALDALGVAVDIRAEPFDLGQSPPFAQDTANASYDADAVRRYWTVLACTERVLGRLRSRWDGKASPVHLFWHSFDLAHARFSGRPAPVAPDADAVTREAYSHEVIAFGFWPGDERRTPFPAFYSYTTPEPDGLAGRPLEPAQAAWQDTGNGHLAVLPYDAVRTATDPDGVLLAFFQSAYHAGADAAGWDPALEHR